MKCIILLFFAFVSVTVFSQKTIVKGKVIEFANGQGMPYAKVRFQNSKIGTLTDSLGNFFIETYYATDSIIVNVPGYQIQSKKIIKDRENTLEIRLQVSTNNLQEVVIKAPDELPSTRLHKLVIANKPINNKEKLEAYEYELYNKIQLDLNNIGDKFTENGIVKRLDVIMDYLDSTDEGKTYLPVILTETISDFYFKNKPKLKKEVVKATRITGIESLQVNQFLGDMYLDINVYDNIYDLFYKSFISPVAPYARNYYKFYLEDSTFIDKNWCYKLRFTPKRTGDLTFEGEMWIHDTTYAIKRISASISPGANLNYITDFYFEQEFEQVEKEVWMMVEEKLITDIRLTENSKLYGLYGRKYSSRRNILINQKKADDFYKSDNTVEFLDSAKFRSDDYWIKARHVKLSEQEGNIIEMVDSLQQTRFFKAMKNLTYLASTGYVLLGKLELGSAFSLVAFNPVEQLRVGLALRTSNNFSKRIELGGKVAYGFGDERFKYMGKIRYNITPKKRGMMTGFYSYDIEQIGQSASALSMGNTFTTVLSTAPFDKLTFVTKAGLNLEKDIKKDFILFTGAEWKSFTPLGLANYQRVNGFDTVSISNIKTTEFTARIRWAKNEEFLSGYFDRTAVTTTNPILSFQTIVGVKGVLGSQYNYQKFEFQFEHYRNLGVFGRLYYGFTVGYINGNTAYPFLKVHEGNQSLYLMSSAFNKLNFLELISDKYVSGFITNQWEGLFFDRIPLIKKMKLRLVTTGKFVLGEVSQRHQSEMLMPTFVKKFNNIPYAETSVGIENILKFGRVDLVWRMTHLDPGAKPLGIRAKLVFNF